MFAYPGNLYQMNFQQIWKNIEKSNKNTDLSLETTTALEALLFRRNIKKNHLSNKLIQLYESFIFSAKTVVKNNDILNIYRNIIISLVNSPTYLTNRFKGFNISKTNLLTSKKLTGYYNKFIKEISPYKVKMFGLVPPLEKLNSQATQIPLILLPCCNKNILTGIGIYKPSPSLEFASLYQTCLPIILKKSTDERLKILKLQSTPNSYQQSNSDKIISAYLLGALGFTAGTLTLLINSPADKIKIKLSTKAPKNDPVVVNNGKSVLHPDVQLGTLKVLIPKLGSVCLSVGVSVILLDQLMKLF